MRSRRRSNRTVPIAAAVLHWTAARPPEAVPPRPVVAETGGTSRGQPDAPVTLEVFSDFRCRYCMVFATTIEPTIVSEFVEPGVVRIVHRNFPVLGPVSEQAAEAAVCAADQGRFWAYHDALFARFSRGELNAAGDLRAAAGEIGLDRSAFDRCLRDGAGRARVEADLAEGERRGVRGTPTSFVGGQMIVGAQPVEVFRAAIEAARPR